jgi:hypothetical protein
MGYQERENAHHRMDALESRAHLNVLIVAFANKMARITWAVCPAVNRIGACLLRHTTDKAILATTRFPTESA